MAGMVMVQEPPKPPCEPAPTAPSLWSRVFGGQASVPQQPSAPPVSALGEGYAVELQTEQSSKLEV